MTNDNAQTCQCCKRTGTDIHLSGDFLLCVDADACLAYLKEQAGQTQPATAPLPARAEDIAQRLENASIERLSWALAKLRPVKPTQEEYENFCALLSAMACAVAAELAGLPRHCATCIDVECAGPNHDVD